MIDIETSRLTRLIALLTLLQSKRMLTAAEFAQKFGVSKRTIYRDLKTLEQAGIPILTQEGKGYSLMEGYKLPPVMFTEDEANALVTVEKLVLMNNDTSLAKNYTDAITKIKAVLGYSAKDKVELLSQRVDYWQEYKNESSSNLLSVIQVAITNFNVINIKYHSIHKNEITHRSIEPFAIINKIGESWYLIAWCRTRKDFRLFRLDRIKAIETTAQHFTPHKLNLEEFLEDYRRKTFTNP